MTLADYAVSADEIATLGKLVGEPAQFWAAVTDRGPWVALARLRALELAGVKAPAAPPPQSPLTLAALAALDSRIEAEAKRGGPAT